jgi:hypothetical protein
LFLTRGLSRCLLGVAFAWSCHPYVLGTGSPLATATEPAATRRTISCQCPATLSLSSRASKQRICIPTLSS